MNKNINRLGLTQNERIIVIPPYWCTWVSCTHTPRVIIEKLFWAFGIKRKIGHIFHQTLTKTMDKKAYKSVSIRGNPQDIYVPIKHKKSNRSQKEENAKSDPLDLICFQGRIIKLFKRNLKLCFNKGFILKAGFFKTHDAVEESLKKQVSPYIKGRHINGQIKLLVLGQEAEENKRENHTYKLRGKAQHERRLSSNRPYHLH